MVTGRVSVLAHLVVRVKPAPTVSLGQCIICTVICGCDIQYQYQGSDYLYEGSYGQEKVKQRYSIGEDAGKISFADQTEKFHWTLQ